jgi:hypothetical protein
MIVSEGGMNGICVFDILLLHTKTETGILNHPCVPYIVEVTFRRV